MEFNNNFVNNWDIFNKTKIGLEIEFFSDYSYVKLLELLNVHFQDVGKTIWGFNSYHSDFTPTDKEFKIEPDYSGGPDMIELITGPMIYTEARIILIKMMEFIKKYGYTDNSSSVHINISFNDNNHEIANMNPLKLILNTDENVIYNIFPSRRNNIYCQSIRWVIPFTDFPDAESGANQILNSLLLPDDTKYYGVNLQKRYKGWLEWRYIGGKDYHLKADEMIFLMDYFVTTTYKSFEPLNEEDSIKLLSYLDDNISWYQKYNTYDDFLANIDGIKIQYDGQGDLNTLRTYWSLIKDKLFQIIKMAKAGSIKDGVFNYNSGVNRFELVDCIISDMFTVKNIDFIDCKISGITAYDSTFNDCVIENSHIWNGFIRGTELTNCKITNAMISEYSDLINCVFDGKEIIDSTMKDGVFRSGKIGENTEIDISVRMTNKESFWSIYDPHNKKISPIKKIDI